MGQAAAIIPVAQSIGKVLGWILIADAVDTAVGSPVKRTVGLPNPVDAAEKARANAERDYNIQLRDQLTAQAARDRAIGFQNYIRALSITSPGYVARHRSKLKVNYNKAIDRREAKIKRSLDDYRHEGRLPDAKEAKER
jgi:hypothetical protein